ncbi:hypothetical protein B0A48_16531 [Cryoendolithus antarcticus]|uniref:Heterokaryon incompatibility domain-containing protein n=1 Tax=Cryoendolithus antarcticus TaxID=1507870 RepID=A0A1V8SF69_9PEZI|nr:hypothetical protein B0A48_16531 [Cryoendolithus antarcticus]
MRAFFRSAPKEQPSRSPEVELSENEIRLLCFAATESTRDEADSVLLMLERATYTRSSAPAYIALSYVWGDAVDQKTVSINGKHVSIQANLYAALCRLRVFVRTSQAWPSRRTLVADSSGSRLHSNQLPTATRFWVDAQCIDQTNIIERNRQVRIMRDIYADAASVFAWTGQLSEHDSAVLDEFYAYLLVPPDLDMWMVEAVDLPPEKGAVNERADYQQTPHGRMDRRLSKVVRRLSTAKNFTRMWCAQELLVPAHLFFLCGKHIISVESFASLVAQADGAQLQQSPAYQSLALRSSFRAVKGSLHAPLGSLLVTFENAQCSDPRDKLFALLGLLPPDHSLRSVCPDYDLTQKDVLIKAVQESRRHASEVRSDARESCWLLLKAFGVPDVCANAVRAWLSSGGRRFHSDVEPIRAGRRSGVSLSFRYSGQPIAFSDSTLTGAELLWAVFGSGPDDLAE